MRNEKCAPLKKIFFLFFFFSSFISFFFLCFTDFYKYKYKFSTCFYYFHKYFHLSLFSLIGRKKERGKNYRYTQPNKQQKQKLYLCFFLLCFAFVLHLFHNFKFLFSFFFFYKYSFQDKRGKKNEVKKLVKGRQRLKNCCWLFFFFSRKIYIQIPIIWLQICFSVSSVSPSSSPMSFFFFFDFVSKGCRSFFFFGFCCRLYNECKKEGRTGSGKPFS